MKKLTIRDVEIEFDDTVNVEISGDKIIVKGRNLPLPPAIITCGQDFSGTNPCPPMLTDGKTYVL